MVDSNKDQHNGKDKHEVAARNRWLAIVLGLIAVGIYVIFIMTHVK